MSFEYVENKAKTFAKQLASNVVIAQLIFCSTNLKKKTQKTSKMCDQKNSISWNFSSKSHQA